MGESLTNTYSLPSTQCAAVRIQSGVSKAAPHVWVKLPVSRSRVIDRTQGHLPFSETSPPTMYPSGVPVRKYTVTGILTALVTWTHEILKAWNKRHFIMRYGIRLPLHNSSRSKKHVLPKTNWIAHRSMAKRIILPMMFRCQYFFSLCTSIRHM